ncbi:hypothetical protein LSG31_19685 [Fodinisporobacter ferrooxydans]|uniref:Uncharacterized protein n=1 Tax=Fodinisporobacter ferrooxydans TaxID=2901836 RepID=A0ABY4CKS3_9BACL|nr:hypothetical protein LSG31_19685 [Alicyclobacillaceae bacterium MYW30-H2]
MAIPKKLDQNTASALRSILSSLNLPKNRMIIDLDNGTVEVEEDHNIDDLLQWAGTLTKEQAKDLQERINKNREEDWD